MWAEVMDEKPFSVGRRLGMGHAVDRVDGGDQRIGAWVCEPASDSGCEEDHQAVGVGEDAPGGGRRHDDVRRVAAGNRGGYMGRRLTLSRRVPGLPIVDAVFIECHHELRSVGFAAKDRWHLMGALEALKRSMLFGLTTAFLFAAIQKVWLVDSAEREG